mgnify:CR=1 FL=1
MQKQTGYDVHVTLVSCGIIPCTILLARAWFSQAGSQERAKGIIKTAEIQLNHPLSSFIVAERWE